MGTNRGILFSLALALSLIAVDAFAWPWSKSNSFVKLPNNTYLADMDGDAMDDFVSFSGNRIFVTHVDYYNTGIMHAYTRGPITDIFLLEMGGSAKDHRASVCAIESSIKLI